MAVVEKHNIQPDVIPGIASGFCGGMSTTGGPCGALVGGIMALGILHGRKSSKDSPQKIYGLTERLVRDFENIYGFGYIREKIVGGAACKISNFAVQAILGLADQAVFFAHWGKFSSGNVGI